jgi:hypothetical protein
MPVGFGRRVAWIRTMSGRTKPKFACSNTDKSRKIILSLMAMYVILPRWDANKWPDGHSLWLPKEACQLLETCVTEVGHARTLLQRKEPAAKLHHSCFVIREFRVRISARRKITVKSVMAFLSLS